MNQVQDQLRSQAKKLLQDGAVQVVIGHQQGTDPHRVAPLFAETAEEAEQLILTPLAGPSVVRYVRGSKQRVAAVVNGCEARLLQTLIREHQVNRDQVHLIGVPCAGKADIDKLAARPEVDLRKLTGVRLEGETVVVETAAGEVKVAKAEVLRSECQACEAPTSTGCDETVGEETGPPAVQDLELGALQGLSREERLAAFRRAFERCVRCYACVNSCSLCYCTVCFAEQTKPQWIPRVVELPENMAFHLGRAMHLAGRCVRCGACDRACPAGVPLRALYEQMAAEIADLFGEEMTGPDQEAPFLVFRPEDTEQAIDGSVKH